MFSKLDCYSGFYQIKLDPNSAKFTAFACEWGLFEYKVMPMGLSNSPATFMRLMNKVFADLIDKGIVIVYMDDILIHSETFAQHLKHVRMVVDLLNQYKLKIKLSKPLPKCFS